MGLVVSPHPLPATCTTPPTSPFLPTIVSCRNSAAMLIGGATTLRYYSGGFALGRPAVTAAVVLLTPLRTEGDMCNASVSRTSGITYAPFLPPT